MKRFTEIIVCVLIAAAMIVLSGCSVSFYDESKLKYERKEDITDAVKSIRLDWESGKIIIEESEDNNLHIVQEYGDDFSKGDLFKFELRNGNLEISDPRLNSIGWHSGNTKLTVLLPSASYDLLDVNSVSASCVVEFDDDGAYISEANVTTVSGSVNIEISAGSLNVSTTSGSLDIESISAPNGQSVSVSAASVSGSVTFERTDSPLQRARFSTVSGRMDVDMDTPADTVNLQTTSGVITVDCSDEVETMNISTVSGSVDLNAEKAIHSLHGNSVSGSFIIQWNKECGFDLDFSAVSGRLKNRFESEHYLDGENMITISSTSGSLLMQPIS